MAAEDSEVSENLNSSEPRKESGVRHRKKQLYQQIMHLMEFYLSDSNLRKDRFFSQLLQENPEIDVSIFLKCNKLARLTSDPDDVVKALKKSTLLEVSEDGTKVKRTAVVQEKPDVDDCMIYVEKLPPDAEHEYIEKAFSRFGKVTYVSLPKFKSTGKLKGFAFVEFSTKEEANKALEAYTEMGCRLPSTMPPESLVSIQTFEGEKSNVTKQEGGFPPSLSSSQEKPADVKNETTDRSPPNKRAKLSDNDGTDEDARREDTNEDTEDHDTSAMSELPGKKKKSRKKKKKKADDNILEPTGMQVLSKIEWKKLRNQYLNLQRIKMKKLKTHLQSIKRTQWTHPHLMEEKKKKTPATEDANGKNASAEADGKDLKYGIEFVPGTIVRVHLDEPLVDVKLFKNELKHKPNVKYVDARVGSQEAFVRCINPEEANIMLESKCFPHCDILKGEEEILYWEKIEYDRKIKFSTKPKTCRGRNKLLKKAEKALGKHIRFDNMVDEDQ